MTEQSNKSTNTKILLIVLCIIGFLLIGDDAFLGPLGVPDDFIGVPLSFGSILMYVFKFLINKKSDTAVDPKATINISPSDQKAIDKN
jgi:hypothetical protein